LKAKPIVFAASMLILATNCSGGDGAGPASGAGGTNPGSGGSATGGATGSATGGNTGATPGSGGNTSTGGASSSGGMTASGGRTATGGATSSGGVMGSGGSGGLAASGGSPGSGGSRGSGGSGAGGGAGGRAEGSGGSAGGGGAGFGSGGRTAMGGAPGTGGGSAGGASSGGYQPCQSNPCKVLPLGDSITYGVDDEGNGGYRGPLFADIVAGGQKVTFTGSLMNGPTTVSGQTFPKRNEGHSGWGISEVTPYSNNNAGIATLIPSPAFSSGSGGTPEIILLHIGTNDSGSFSSAQMQTDLKGLLDKLFTNAPNALVVLAKIIPLGYDPNNATIKSYNQALPGIVQTLADAGKHIVLVDMNTGYAASNYGSDSIHPNTAGYKFMADRWYAAIGPLLPH